MYMPAGGMDALFAVVLGPAAQEEVCAMWQKRGCNPLLLSEDDRGLHISSTTIN